MSNKIILKKSSVTSKVPLTSDLDYGELALNYADGVLYYKTASNSIGAISGGSGAIISDDTTTNATRYLVFEDITSGSMTTASVASTKLTFTPSSGRLVSTVVGAASGIMETSNTINANYTITTGYNAMSAGPVTVTNGTEITIPDGSTWTVV